MLLTQIFGPEYPSAKKKTTEYGQGPHQPVPLYRKEMKWQRNIRIDQPVYE